jgi:hypothetical protein
MNELRDIMELTNNIHTKAIDIIKQQREQSKSWNDIEKMNIFGIGESSFEVSFNIAKNAYGIQYPYTENEWAEVVRYVKEKEKEKEKTVVKIERGTRNDAKISASPQSAWRLYRKGLLEKGWTTDSVEGIEESSFEILKMLSQNTLNSGPVKGLVVGNVQSGKTANMAGLISMAADYGFNYFIILSGMIENLRQQTEERMFEDVAKSGNLNWQIVKNPKPHRVYNLADKMENLDLSESSNKRYMSVVLKNSSRLENLVKWLYSQPNKAKQLKVLIIDDEADQASINTKKISEEEAEERSKINAQLIKLVHGYNNLKLKASNYISYTATPYANVLNESGDETLYPNDFIMALTPSPDYIGPRQIFGLKEPESHANLEITRSISNYDVELLNDIHSGNSNNIPKSLKQAIQWYLIASMAMQVNGHRKPISMLVHTSHKMNDHENIEKVIANYLRQIKRNKEDFIEECEELYNIETSDFDKKDFINGMGNYSIPSEKIRDYPKWEEVERRLKALLARDEDTYLSRIKMDDNGKLTYHRGIHLCIDNSRSSATDGEHVRLVYPSKTDNLQHATLFIVIGGNTLSRGLTLEGLTTSYFMRNTITSDTLMQMGRWFGYRFGYELFPRIWLNSLVRDRFGWVTQIDEELREEIKEFNRIGLLPKDVGIKVTNSPNNALLKLTSNNKMQNSLETDLNFEGVQKQTIVFEDDSEVLQSNIRIADEFLNGLDQPIPNGNRLVWHKVPYEKVKSEFLERYKAPSSDIMFSNLNAFMEWCDANKGNKSLNEWNIILSSRGEIKHPASEKDWNVGGYGVENVQRTVLNSTDKGVRTISIGALRSPKDLLTDIIDILDEDVKGTKNISEVKEIRERYGYDEIPQLVIYRIDKNSSPIGESKTRKPLDFSEDVIGISLMIPGLRSGSNIAKKVTVKLENQAEDNQEIEEN